MAVQEAGDGRDREKRETKITTVRSPVGSVLSGRAIIRRVSLFLVFPRIDGRTDGRTNKRTNEGGNLCDSVDDLVPDGASSS